MLAEADVSAIMDDMRTISVAVSDEDYEKFREVAAESERSIAQLIRAAMAHYRATVLESRRPLVDLPVLAGHRPIGPTPSRGEVYDEVFDSRRRQS